MKNLFLTVVCTALCQFTFAEEAVTEINSDVNSEQAVTEITSVVPEQTVTEISNAVPEQPVAPTSHYADTKQPKSEISASVGLVPMMSFAHLFANVFTAPLSGGCKGSDLNLMSFNASYGYHVANKVVVGATVNFANVTNKYPEMSDQLQQSFNYLAVMPFLKINWVNKDHFCFYSRVAVGPAFEFAKETKADKPAENNFRTICLFQISPAGFEWGGKNFRGFAEAGFGQEGYVQIGFRYRF